MTRNPGDPLQIKHPLGGHSLPRVKALVLDAQPFGEIGHAINALGSFFDHGQHEGLCRSYLPTLSIADVGAYPAGFAYQVDMDTLGKRLREARKAARLTQQAVADHFGIDRVNVTQWEGDTTRPDQDRVPKLARLYGVDLEWLMTAQGNGPTTPAPRPASASKPPVPLIGSAVGHEGDDWVIRRDVEEPIPRPSGIPAERAVFALKVVGDSMDPAYREGATIYMEQFGSVRAGDIVLIVVKHGPHDEERSGFVKKLVRRTSRKLICEQFNPRKSIEFDVGDVEALYRVIPWEELVG